VRQGAQVDVVENGLLAVDRVATEARYDAVLMDVQMPVMDGLTATDRIRNLGGTVAGIPIIALTPNAMDGDREYCLSAGMTDYVTKPISLEALSTAMARSLAPRPAANGGAPEAPLAAPLPPA
jgi:two-component system, sensor histidine kinase and response regulator